jgi:rhamnose utilization protein RhaD (predicted bifunctional aldolase and dehydrogenase)/NAD(P)-dependent dehydrogenase (short-subunit alcohol dehydrogenase family)
VYTSRLIGEEPDLVLHGGGNTSLKSTVRDLFADEVDVLHIKGTGWDLASIEPKDLPAVRLEPLRRLRGLESLDDETIVAELRRALLDPNAPNPSVETLLHAFLPHRFIDHSHADAILAITNQPDPEERVRSLFGERVVFVPYVMPGFTLAKLAVELYEKSSDAEGLVLEKHGLFTFGEDARTSYDRHVELVDIAERFILEKLEGERLLNARPVVAIREPDEIAPIVRGALAEPTGDPDQPFRRWILEHRTSDEILHFAAADDAPRLVSTPPITPDHVIRTKGPYLLLTDPPYGNPGLGLFACGATRRDARIAADIAEHNVKTKIWAEMIGRYEGISDGDLFDIEYWSLEQAKLGKRTPPPLQGQVALITGGGGAIGEGIARVLRGAGAEIVLADDNEDRVEAVRDRIGPDDCETVLVDIGEERQVARAFREAAGYFGGVDIVVATAGVAETGELDELETEAFDRAERVNVRGTFLTMREALRHLKAQATAGHIVLISSKNVFAPGAGFGAYSASKAGAHQLGKIAALEAAQHGIRVNMINADAVFGTRENPSGLWEKVGAERAASRGLSEEELPEFYRSRNLLKVRVTPEHVGNAVLFFVTGQTPTTGAALPVDGGLPDAFPR